MSAKHKACVHCETRIPMAVAVCPFCGGRQPDPRPALAEAERAARATLPGGPAPPPAATTQTFEALRPGQATTQAFEARRLTPAGDSAAVRRASPTPPPSPAPPTPRALRDARFAAGPQAQRRSRGRTFWILSLLVILGGLAVWWRFAPRALPLAALVPFGEAAEALPRPCGDQQRCLVIYLTPWDPSSARTLNTLERLQGLIARGELGLAVIVGADSQGELEAFARDIPLPTWLDPEGAAAQRLRLDTVPTWALLDVRGRIRETVAGTYFPLDYHLLKLGLSLAAPEGP